MKTKTIHTEMDIAARLYSDAISRKAALVQAVAHAVWAGNVGNIHTIQRFLTARNTLKSVEVAVIRALVDGLPLVMDVDSGKAALTGLKTRLPARCATREATFDTIGGHINDLCKAETARRKADKEATLKDTTPPNPRPTAGEVVDAVWVEVTPAHSVSKAVSANPARMPAPKVVASKAVSANPAQLPAPKVVASKAVSANPAQLPAPKVVAPYFSGDNLTTLLARRAKIRDHESKIAEIEAEINNGSDDDTLLDSLDYHIKTVAALTKSIIQ